MMRKLFSSDDSGEKLVPHKKKGLVLEHVKQMTKAGKSGKAIFSKVQQFSEASQSRPLQVFHSIAEAADYLDQAAYFFPPAKVFTEPLSTCVGTIDDVVQLRSFFKTIAAGTTDVVPLLLLPDLINMRDALCKELWEYADDSSFDPEETALIRGLDSLIFMLEMVDKPPD